MRVRRLPETPAAFNPTPTGQIAPDDLRPGMRRAPEASTSPQFLGKLALQRLDLLEQP
jgi:hypothetical protein